MDLTQSSNPDPHGVQRLLSLLRAQQDAAAAGKAASATPPSPQQHPFFSSAQPTVPHNAHDDTAASTTARRNYSSQPRYGTGTTPTDVYDPYSFNPFAPTSVETPRAGAAAVQTPSPAKEEVIDTKNMTFSQSLPLLSALAADTGFITELRTMRTEQHTLERKLAAQYQSHATLARATTPQQQQRSSSTNGDRALRTSILQQWDDLRQQQARRLAELNVPTFGGASNPTVLKHRAKVFAVLVSMLDDDDDDDAR